MAASSSSGDLGSLGVKERDWLTLYQPVRKYMSKLEERINDLKKALLLRFIENQTGFEFTPLNFDKGKVRFSASADLATLSQDAPDLGWEKIYSVYCKFLIAYHELNTDLRLQFCRSSKTPGAEDPLFDKAVQKMMQLKVLRQSAKDMIQSMTMHPEFFSVIGPAEGSSFQADFKKFKEVYAEIERGSDFDSHYVELSRAYFSLKYQMKRLLFASKDDPIKCERLSQMLRNIQTLYRRAQSPEQRALPPMSLNINPATLAKIQADLPQILARKKNKKTKLWEGPSLPGYTYHSSQSSHRVFSLDSEPDVIFKIQAEGDADSMRKRIKNVHIGRLVCRKKQFAHLKVPKVELHRLELDGGTIQLMAERKLPLFSFQESKKGYETPDTPLCLPRDEGLVETPLLELIRFTCLLHYSDIAVRNIPFYQGKNSLRIGMIDLEEFGGAKLGIYGGVYGPGRFKRTGLVNVVGNALDKQFVKAVATGMGVRDPKEEADQADS